ncbi:hypothetical protein F5Y05DRAFT_138016 [Hypoxylon sp. FL0543]|nr:hypothetical protein F5Y05DRAFT_138016 [Hypoxylon sp. FL0543]
MYACIYVGTVPRLHILCCLLRGVWSLFSAKYEICMFRYVGRLMFMASNGQMQLPQFAVTRSSLVMQKVTRRRKGAGLVPVAEIV